MPASNQPGLGPIRCVTFTASDLDAVRHCYADFLDYRVVETGQIEQGLAEAWQAPAVGGRDYLLMAPAAASDCFFRVIDGPAPVDYVPFASFGWNAAEIMVEDVDAMADRVAGSPFKVVGAPQDLSFSPDIRAMQILGPGGELLYLTQFKRPVPGLDVPLPRCSVDKTFIVILGGPSMDGLQTFYADSFGVSKAAVVESRVKGLSAAFNLPPDFLHPIAALPLAGQCLIEADEMPAGASARSTARGELAPGISIVSFVGQSASGKQAEASGLLYGSSNQTRVVPGVAGELVELINAGPA